MAERGEVGVIENTTALLPYLDDLAVDPLNLGTALGRAKMALPIIKESAQSNIIQIFMTWMAQQSLPTWELLHGKLLVKSEFEATAKAIRTDHLIMREEIKDVGELMQYFKGVLHWPIQLGTALGIPNETQAIVQNKPGSPHANSLIILGNYISCTGHCTWKKFYDRLKRQDPAFKNVTSRIKKDHNIVDDDIPQQQEVLPPPQPQQVQQEQEIVQEHRDEPDGDQSNEDSLDINKHTL